MHALLIGVEGQIIAVNSTTYNTVKVNQLKVRYFDFANSNDH